MHTETSTQGMGTKNLCSLKKITYKNKKRGG